ncbi:ankyrin repeat domain-containing protein [Aspergillus melleus]|uniref:ankyrin repeat domain-containing protein n=1 Tax=Aspergillus melleus TaxID=138277 RepID=UPI001E8CD18B|nr:uncharacterized protein LDX57_009172 [Aspergillus melleus]KAH8431509.1 hypothetical protein LDX57_009172 [Aspergillus melleus]
MLPKASPTDCAAYEKEFYDACDNADGDKIMSFLGHAKLSSETLCKGFESACKNGDLRKVKEALASKQLPTETLKNGLYVATFNGHLDIVTALFKARVPRTPLSVGALSVSQDPRIIRLYFDRGLKPSNCKTSRGEPLLRFVDAACAREFLERGVDPNRCGPKKIPPLASAVESAYEDGGALFDLLVEYGAKIEGSLFFYAINRSLSNTAFKTRFLLSRGLNPNVTSAEWGTPLHCAVHFAMQDVIQVLLDAGADPTMRVECRQFPNETPAEVAEFMRQSDPDDEEEFRRVLNLLPDAPVDQNTSQTTLSEQPTDGSQLEQTKMNAKRVHGSNPVQAHTEKRSIQDATEPTERNIRTKKQHTASKSSPKNVFSQDNISSRTRSRTNVVP